MHLEEVRHQGTWRSSTEDALGQLLAHMPELLFPTHPDRLTRTAARASTPDSDQYTLVKMTD